MQELYNLGISENTIKSMLEFNPNLKDITDSEVIKKENILKSIGCSESQIVSIISSNAMYLDRIDNDVIELLTYLSRLGFSVLSVLIDSNPYILNLDVFEIENYIKSRLKNNELLEDIIDDLDSNPYLFNEM